MTGEVPDTLPKLLLRNAAVRGARPAMREKDFGIWQTWTWSELAQHVRDIAAGLAGLGFKRGDKLAVVGDNRPQLYAAMAACQSLGGIAVPVYQDAVADEMAYVIDHADIAIAVAEDQEQVDKLLAIRAKVPRLATIVYDDPRGMRHYTDAGLVTLAALVERGRVHNAAQPGFFADQVASGGGGDISVMLYTSGTTGTPKGVMLSHRSVIETARIAAEFEHLDETEEVMAYLPMAWVGDHTFSYAQALYCGFCINCPESGATVLNDLREIGPTYFFAPPRIWENLLTTVSIRMEDAAWLKRRMYDYFLGVARRARRAKAAGTPVALADRLLGALGEVLVYGPLKNTLGFSRMRLGYTEIGRAHV